MKLIIYVDGGSRGNPGPAGAGVFIQDENGIPIVKTGHWLGRMTNNMAEYSSLLFALDAARRLPPNNISIFTDSQLMARQIRGEYRVKNAKLKPLYADAVQKLGCFDHWEITDIRRELNTEADALANMAMDAGEDVVIFDMTAVSEDPHPTGNNVPDTTAGHSHSDRPPIVVRCVNVPEKETCEAMCRKGAEFVFHQTVPSGICLNAAIPILTAVLRIQSEKTCPASRSPTSANTAITVCCDKPGCGAEFSVQRVD